MTRIDKILYILKHKKIMYDMYKVNDTRVPLIRIILHDLDKVFLTLILGTDIASKIHQKCVRHHNVRTDVDLAEAYLDWTSARYSKADKPLDALETAEKLHPELYFRVLKHYKNVKFK